MQNHAFEIGRVNKPSNELEQGILTEREGLVPLTSLH